MINMTYIYDEFMHKLKTQENFSLVRYGDGEWALALKKEPTYSIILRRFEKVDGLIRSGDAMLDIIKSSPKYYFGLQNLALSLWPEDIESTIPADVNVINADMLHRLSKMGSLGDFFDVLKTRELILLGPDYLENLNFLTFDHVVSPDPNSWDYCDELQAQIEEKLVGKTNPVILYSASIAAKIIIDRIYNKYGETITQIDTGSLLDPYAGVCTREYHKTVLARLSSLNT